MASLVLASCAEEEVVVDEDEDEVDVVVDEDEDEDEVDVVIAPPVGEPQRGGTLTYFYMSQSDPTMAFNGVQYPSSRRADSGRR